MNEHELSRRICECIEMLEILQTSIGDKTGNDKDTIIYGCRPSSVNFVIQESMELLSHIFYGGETND